MNTYDVTFPLGIKVAGLGLAAVVAIFFIGAPLLIAISATVYGGVAALAVWALVAVDLISAPGFTALQYIVFGLVMTFVTMIFSRD